MQVEHGSIYSTSNNVETLTTILGLFCQGKTLGGDSPHQCRALLLFSLLLAWKNPLNKHMDCQWFETPELSRDVAMIQLSTSELQKTTKLPLTNEVWWNWCHEFFEIKRLDIARASRVCYIVYLRKWGNIYIQGFLWEVITLPYLNLFS